MNLKMEAVLYKDTCIFFFWSA